jgi:mercuric ion transport protein
MTPIDETQTPRAPRRVTVSAALGALACAVSCSLPLFIGAGVLTGAGAAIAERTLLAVAGLLVAAAAGMWWLHRRRSARRVAAAEGSGTDGPYAC